jgi:flavin prenyltransferase
MGAIIEPLLPACYAKPLSLGGMVDQTIGRVQDVLGIDIDFTCCRREGN